MRLRPSLIVCACALMAQTVYSDETLQPGSTFVTVTTHHHLTPHDIRALASQGLDILEFLNTNQYIARIVGDPDTPALARRHGLATIRGLTPADKLHSGFRVRHPERNPVLRGGLIPINIQYFEHAAQPGDIHALIADTDGTVQSTLVSLPIVCAIIPGDQFEEIADDPRIRWIEPALPALQPLNAENRSLTNVDTLHAPPFGLTGAGVEAFVWDSGFTNPHFDLADRVRFVGEGRSDAHATHVTGTLAGDGTVNPTHRGMAPRTAIISGARQAPPDPNNGGSLNFFDDPGDLEQDLLEAFALSPDNLAVFNASLGANLASQDAPCELHGDYNISAALIDAIAAGSLGKPLTQFWAGGNERSADRCIPPDGFGTIAPPAAAKNAILVGAVYSDNDSVTTFSSFGPTDDGRTKPDIVAPGCQLSGDGGVTSLSGISMYAAQCGTSMASPTAAGIAALLIEDFRNRYPFAPDPLPSTIKALLAHTAQDIDNPGPDYRTGFGSVRADAGVNLLRTGDFSESRLDHAQQATFPIVITETDTPLKITLAWDDAPASPAATSALVNDLDVTLISPSGVVHFPWTLDPGNPGAPAVQTKPDRINNLEQVVVASPEPGTWTACVDAHNVPLGPQTFSIAASPDLIAPTLRIGVQNTNSLRIAPGAEHQIDASVIAQEQSIAPGSVTLWTQIDDDQPRAMRMLDAGDDTFTAWLPAISCEQTLQYWIEATGSETGTTRYPMNSNLHATPGVIDVPFQDDFEQDNAWTTAQFPNSPPTGTLDGQWERGIPAGAGARADPREDADGSGSCYLTANRFGNSDVDNGTFTLTSPAITLDSQDAHVSYSRWFNNTSPNENKIDTLLVEASPDDGQTWFTIEQVGPAGPDAEGGWVFARHPLPPQATATGTVRVRFTITDLPPGDTIEAAIDGFSIDTVSCSVSPIAPCDLDNSGALTTLDVVIYLDYFTLERFGADFNQDGRVSTGDILDFLAAWAAGC